MLKLSKLYSLLNRNAFISLTGTKHSETFFSGNVKDIPDAFDSWIVNDIIEHSSYDFTIEIVEG